MQASYVFIRCLQIVWSLSVCWFVHRFICIGVACLPVAVFALFLFFVWILEGGVLFCFLVMCVCVWERERERERKRERERGREVGRELGWFITAFVLSTYPLPPGYFLGSVSFLYFPFSFFSANFQFFFLVSFFFFFEGQGGVEIHSTHIVILMRAKNNVS